MPRIMVDELIDYGKRIGTLGPKWCHLTTDGDLEDLHEFALRLGLKRLWCSDFTQPKSEIVHYDLVGSKRTLALRMGAVFVPALDQARERVRVANRERAQTGRFE